MDPRGPARSSGSPHPETKKTMTLVVLAREREGNRGFLGELGVDTSILVSFGFFWFFSFFFSFLFFSFSLLFVSVSGWA